MSFPIQPQPEEIRRARGGRRGVAVIMVLIILLLLSVLSLSFMISIRNTVDTAESLRRAAIAENAAIAAQWHAVSVLHDHFDSETETKLTGDGAKWTTPFQGDDVHDIWRVALGYRWIDGDHFGGGLNQLLRRDPSTQEITPPTLDSAVYFNEKYLSREDQGSAKWIPLAYYDQTGQDIESWVPGQPEPTGARFVAQYAVDVIDLSGRILINPAKDPATLVNRTETKSVSLLEIEGKIVEVLREDIVDPGYTVARSGLNEDFKGFFRNRDADSRGLEYCVGSYYGNLIKKPTWFARHTHTGEAWSYATGSWQDLELRRDTGSSYLYCDNAVRGRSGEYTVNPKVNYALMEGGATLKYYDSAEEIETLPDPLPGVNFHVAKASSVDSEFAYDINSQAEQRKINLVAHFLYQALDDTPSDPLIGLSEGRNMGGTRARGTVNDEPYPGEIYPPLPFEQQYVESTLSTNRRLSTRLTTISEEFGYDFYNWGQIAQQLSQNGKNISKTFVPFLHEFEKSNFYSNTERKGEHDRQFSTTGDNLPIPVRRHSWKQHSGESPYWDYVYLMTPFGNAFEEDGITYANKRSGPYNPSTPNTPPPPEYPVQWTINAHTAPLKVLEAAIVAVDELIAFEDRHYRLPGANGTYTWVRKKKWEKIEEEKDGDDNVTKVLFRLARDTTNAMHAPGDPNLAWWKQNYPELCAELVGDARQRVFVNLPDADLTEKIGEMFPYGPALDAEYDPTETPDTVPMAEMFLRTHRRRYQTILESVNGDFAAADVRIAYLAGLLRDFIIAGGGYPDGLSDSEKILFDALKTGKYDLKDGAFIIVSGSSYIRIQPMKSRFFRVGIRAQFATTGGVSLAEDRRDFVYHIPVDENGVAGQGYMLYYNTTQDPRPFDE